MSEAISKEFYETSPRCKTIEDLNNAFNQPTQSIAPLSSFQKHHNY
jgi:hypothetical protein